MLLFFKSAAKIYLFATTQIFAEIKNRCQYNEGYTHIFFKIINAIKNIYTKKYNRQKAGKKKYYYLHNYNTF